MKRTALVCVGLALSIAQLLGCARGSADADQGFAVRAIDSPAGPGSGEPNLFAAADGQIYLSWLEPVGEERHALRFAVRQEEGWSAPGTIAEGSDWFVNWADFPSLIELDNGLLAAHWLAKSGSGTYAYDVRISFSSDGGTTWSRPISPHRDGTQTEHGFVSLLPWTGGRLFAVWLDGRYFDLPKNDGQSGPTGEMTLRSATIAPDGQIEDEVELDARVCDCCQTAAVRTADGVLVAYRDRSKQEIRDISIVRFENGRWTEPKTLYADNWKIPGCPVNGPAVAALGRKVAVAWYTAAQDIPRVKIAFSNDGGKTFEKPVQVDNGNPVGRVDVIWLPDESALVSWIENTEDGGEIRVRRVRADGSFDAALTIAQSSSGRASGFPRMVRNDSEIVFAWTHTSRPSQVRTAVAELANLR